MTRREGSKESLLDAAQAAVEAGQRSGPRSRRTGWGLRRWLMMLSLGLSAALGWALLSRPPWLLTPPPDPEPVAIQEASIRLAMVREAHRIEAFRRMRGRLPATLLEAGGTMQAVEYVKTGAREWMLVHRAPEGDIRLGSGDDVMAFLGRSLSIISSERIR